MSLHSCYLSMCLSRAACCLQPSRCFATLLCSPDRISLLCKVLLLYRAAVYRAVLRP